MQSYRKDNIYGCIALYISIFFSLLTLNHSMIKKRILFPVILVVVLGGFSFWAFCNNPEDNAAAITELSEHINPHQTIYEKLNLSENIGFDVFDKAMTGYESIEGRKKDILVLVDFSKPSTDERLYVIDVKEQKVLYHSVVAHGRGSGDNYATSFSNVPGSNQSSLGFYLTANTYQGQNGYSLRLKGLERGINDKAMERAIVIHGADYADPKFIPYAGRLGRSLGCPSLPKSLNDDIINTIKDGSVLFIYAADNEYLSHSPILTQKTIAVNGSVNKDIM